MSRGNREKGLRQPLRPLTKPLSAVIFYEKAKRDQKEN